MIEEWIREITLTISLVVEGVAALLVAYAVAEALVRLLRTAAIHSGRRPPQAAHDAKEEIRLRLGRWLALSLELLLGADILRTAVAPTWSEIGQLAAIATIRTGLNYFLQRESDAAQARREDSPAKPYSNIGSSGVQGSNEGGGSSEVRARS